MSIIKDINLAPSGEMKINWVERNMPVLRGIGRLDMGLATVGGVGIVILAIILDRLTQAVGRDARSRGNRRWYTTGPLGLITRPFCR